MLKLLTCVQGHFWEVAQPSDNGTAPDAATFRCPVCGGPADELPLIDLAPSDTALEIATTPLPAAKPPALLDARGEPIVAGYEILEALGKNRKGVLLFRAKQILINRIVLLKVVLARDDVGQMSWGALRGEANALAKLVHPNIPQIYDVGERDRQLFYNAVELFEGVELAAKVQGKPVPPKVAAQFVENVARALHFAHEQGVVHRCLKPASILLEATEGKALDRCTFKIVDFGLAGRPVEGDVNDIELQGKLPQYLAPEQAWGYSKDIGACSDVYALGVLLYELLAGRPPYRGERASEIIEQIRSRPPTPPREVNGRVPTDLDAICRKCLQKPPRKRYSSALALADELRRYQEGMPIKAHDIGSVTRLFLWVRRHPALVFILFLLVTMFFSTLIAFGIGSSRGDSDSQAYRSTLNSLRNAQQETANANIERDKAREGVALTAYYHAVARADLAVKDGRLDDARTILNGCTPAYRQLEWSYLMSRANDSQPRVFQPGLKNIVRVQFSPNNQWLAVAGEDAKTGKGAVFLLDSSLGTIHHQFSLTTGRPQDVAFSPDSAALAILSDRDAPDVNSGQLEVYNLSRMVRSVFSVPIGRATSVAFSPNGLYLGVGFVDGDPVLFNAADGSNVFRGRFRFAPRFTLGNKKVCIAFSANSDYLASCDGDSGRVQIFGVTRDDNEGPIFVNFASVKTLSYAPDGQLALGCTDKTVRIFDRFVVERNVLPCNSNVQRVLFTADGKRLAVLLESNADGKPPVLHWYDGTSFQEILAITDLPNSVTAIALDKLDRRLAVASSTEVRIYGATNNP